MVENPLDGPGQDNCESFHTEFTHDAWERGREEWKMGKLKRHHCKCETTHTYTGHNTNFLSSRTYTHTIDIITHAGNLFFLTDMVISSTTHQHITHTHLCTETMVSSAPEAWSQCHNGNWIQLLVSLRQVPSNTLRVLANSWPLDTGHVLNSAKLKYDLSYREETIQFQPCQRQCGSHKNDKQVRSWEFWNNGNEGWGACRNLSCWQTWPIPGSSNCP